MDKRHLGMWGRLIAAGCDCSGTVSDSGDSSGFGDSSWGQLSRLLPTDLHKLSTRLRLSGITRTRTRTGTILFRPPGTPHRR